MLKKKGWLILLSLSLLAACQTSQSTGEKAPKEEMQMETNLSSEEKEILTLHEQLRQGMVSKDTESIAAVVSNRYTLTHITGYKQTREEWFNQIRDEQMKYYKADVKDYKIEVAGSNGVLTTKNRVDARIYGSRNTWNLQLEHQIEKSNGQWRILSTVATLY